MKHYFLTLTVLVFICIAPFNMLIASDKELVTYSSEVFCILQKNNVQKRYLKVYLERLGAKPTDSFCDKVNGLVDSARPAKWDFKFGRPYPGSAIKLTAHQIALIKASREAKVN